MKCPNDQTEMEKGCLVLHGNGWRRYDTGIFSRIFLRGFTFGERVFAWKCPKCGKIELYTEEKK
jgi:hypothetical protein